MIKPDKIIRSKRKTIALIVTQDAQVVVRAPNRVSTEYLESLVEQKNAWIQKKKDYVMKLKETHKEKMYVEGEGFLFLGRWVRLSIGQVVNAIRAEGELLLFPENDLPNAKEAIESWYRDQFKEIIYSRVEWFQKSYGFSAGRVSVSGAKRRWGSCGARNTLNFSWRLISAPVEVIDYVVLHELCHTVEKNHSARFWAKVRTIMPDYKNHIQWLKQNQRLMEM
jgi:hypothetical protein